MSVDVGNVLGWLRADGQVILMGALGKSMPGRIWRRSRRSAGLWLMLAGMTFGHEVASLADAQGEPHLKAALLLNLSRFVQWPESAFDSTNAPLVMGVLGCDPSLSLLEEVVRGEEVHRRRIEIERYSSLKDSTKCHLLFIAASEQRAMESILVRLENRPILTISDAERFTRYGGVIKLITKPNGRIGLRINAGAAKVAKLSLSAMLLQVAEIVNAEDD